MAAGKGPACDRKNLVGLESELFALTKYKIILL
jgi:hypothetical protein